jgi:hypothetical protein
MSIFYHLLQKKSIWGIWKALTTQWDRTQVGYMGGGYKRSSTVVDELSTFRIKTTQKTTYEDNV